MPRRPPRERWDDDDDIARLIRKEPSWLDKQFGNTPVVVLVFFALCCGVIALAFGIAGAVGCQDPVAKQRAMIVLVISAVLVVANIAIRIAAEMAQ
jgi:hypothetical protein